MRPGAIVLVPLAVLAAGCGSASTRDAGSDPTPRVEAVTPSKPTTKIAGGTPKQRALLREILSGLGPTKVRSIEVASESDGVAFRARADGREDGYGLWEANLVGDVFARRSLELGLPSVVWIEDETGGEATYDPDLAAALAKPRLTVAQAKNDLMRVIEIARQHGASAHVHLLLPDRPAFAVELRTNEPARFLRDGLDATLAPITDEDRRRYDGRYVKVVDDENKDVLESGASFWVRRTVSGCVHVIVSRDPAEAGPPACPASH